jgi:hypothetical protein
VEDSASKQLAPHLLLHLFLKSHKPTVSVKCFYRRISDD